MITPLGTRAWENQTTTRKKTQLSGNKPLQGTDSKLTLPFFITERHREWRVGRPCGLYQAVIFSFLLDASPASLSNASFPPPSTFSYPMLYTSLSLPMQSIKTLGILKLNVLEAPK